MGSVGLPLQSYSGHATRSLVRVRVRSGVAVIDEFIKEYE